MDLPDGGGKSVLPYGNGRSYGDVCLNDRGVLIDARSLDRFLSFDSRTGRVRCEGGVLLSELLKISLPRGWFLPVTPGTKFVTVGGAIANDVHGKNHHRAGTFGCHVRQFELLRSDGERLTCSPEQNGEWFRATIGGLGLTGMITWAEIDLKPVRNEFLVVDTTRFSCLDEFLALSDAADREFEYTVAWLDCLAGGSNIGRGIFMAGNHAGFKWNGKHAPVKRDLSVPFDPPRPLVNGFSIRLFNEIYFRGHPKYRRGKGTHYDGFFYPLDSIADWNRIYGPRGFFQYQCVVPRKGGKEALEEMLRRIRASGGGSFLAVMKVFGNIPSPGMLSFPRPGITLALDFANRGAGTRRLISDLDAVVLGAGGAVYPAKDALMSADCFRKSFPAAEEFSSFRDPAFSSSFWRRVMGGNGCRRS